MSGAASPGGFGATERWPKAEIGILAGDRFEIVAIVNGVFASYAEEERELSGVRMRQIIGRHGAERRDAGTGGDEDSFFRWIANDEESERRGHLNGIARLHREKMWSKDAGVHQIQAELEAIAIGERAPNFAEFTFDAHRWLATVRSDFGVRRDAQSLGLRAEDATLQQYLFDLVGADDLARKWHATRDRQHLDAALLRYSRILAALSGAQQRHLKKVRDYCEAKAKFLRQPI